MSPLDLALIGLAAWYWAVVIALTHGPWRVFERLRTRAPLGGLTTCVYCLAIWLALGFWLLSQTPAAPLVFISAGAGAAIFLHRWTGGDLL